VILVIGEILFDIFPQYERLGGAPFNFAYHLKHFGFPVRFVSRVGHDENGAKILERISAAGFDPADIQRDKTRPTGTVRVALDEMGVPTFDIITDVAYDAITYRDERHAKILASAEMLYFGTLARRTGRGRDQIGHFLDRKPPGCTAFCDINLRSGGYNTQSIESSLRYADILKLNTQELRECLRVAGISNDAPDAVERLMAAYKIETLALTKGDRGSELYTSAEVVRGEPQPVENMADTVGAGDAYAAMLAAGILKGWKPQQTLSRASAFAARICAIEGALPDSAHFYAPLRKRMRNGV
jgi:fructokinase